MDDPRLQRFVLQERQKLKMQEHVNELTERCWDQCVTGNPGQKLGYKTESCIQNCVNRFLDSANYVANRLNTMASQRSAEPASELS